jgi:hypothetical protein
MLHDHHTAGSQLFDVLLKKTLDESWCVTRLSWSDDENIIRSTELIHFQHDVIPYGLFPSPQQYISIAVRSSSSSMHELWIYNCGFSASNLEEEARISFATIAVSQVCWLPLWNGCACFVVATMDTEKLYVYRREILHQKLVGDIC